MALEIERKFHVISADWKQHAVNRRHLRQAYLAKNERISLRVRIDGTEAATLTIKTVEAGIERHEYEYAVPVADAEELLTRCEGVVVSKTRHIVQLGDLMWEVDVFEGENAGLVIAEVELDRADRPLERPAWLGEEVTDDRRFYNAELANRPYSRW